MTDLLNMASLLVTAAAVIAATVVLATTRLLALALPVFLEFVTAAGLIRLAAEPTWMSLLMAASIVAVRRFIVAGLRVHT